MKNMSKPNMSEPNIKVEEEDEDEFNFDEKEGIWKLKLTDEEYKELGWDEKEGIWKTDKKTEDSLKNSGYGFLLKNKNLIPSPFGLFMAVAKKNQRKNHK